MLHREMLDLKFEDCDYLALEQDVPARTQSPGPDLSTHSSPLIRAAQMVGNVVAGSLFMGALLMAPLWLERLVY